MLSIENPPPDPPEISQLKSSTVSSDEERASDHKFALPEIEVDLLKSGLEDHNPLPKFSIRDYVFTARNKDIKTNWPFSQKNLQLCLKYGVKDVLPPFQPLDSVRNPSIKGCTVQTSLIEKASIGNLDGEPSMPKDHFVSGSSDCAGLSQKLALDCLKIGSSETETDKELLLTANLVSSRKTESTSQSPIKKCRLIVKVGGGAGPCLNEDSTAKNRMAIAETMASNVCPVCKTFSSSSNTTLNAHIDQCLSVESNAAWTANSRVIKHRIKPRKIRLMVDVYATALPCTLEELDRRNGTNWAMNSSLPTRVAVERAEEERQREQPVKFQEKGDEGSVYIDSNGTKVRILSKFNNVSPVAKLAAVLGPRKPFRGCRGRNLLSSYKKRHHLQKHHKYLKGQKNYPSKPRPTSEVHGDERNFVQEESCLKQAFKVQEQINPDVSGTITKWACSKRTRLLKRRRRKEGLLHLGCDFRPELLVKTDRSSLGDSHLDRSCVKKTPNWYESPLSSPESSQRVENSYFEGPVQKRSGSALFDSQISGNMKRLLEQPDRNVKQLRKDSTSINGSCKDFASNGENYLDNPFLNKEAGDIEASQAKYICKDVGPNLSKSHHTFSSKAKKFCSLRKHMSVNQSPVRESKVNKCPSDKKPGVRCAAQIVKEVVELPSEDVGKHASKVKLVEYQSRIGDKNTGNVSLGRCNAVNIRKKKRTVEVSRNKEEKGFKSASIHSRDLADTCDDMGLGRNGIQPHGDSIVVEPSSQVDVGGNVPSLSISFDPEFHKLVTPSKTVTGSLQSLVFKKPSCGAETLSCPTNTYMGDEHEMFCTYEVRNCMIAQNTAMGTEMDSYDGQGNYFSEVDRIPIPGPPGSFLPSPRDMSSEDLQGNSSLTTSRVQSSDEHHDPVDRDSSDSPISATSSISNCTIARSDSKYSDMLSVVPQVTRTEIRLGFSGASHDAVSVEAVSCPQAVTTQAERINPDDLKFSMIGSERGPFRFRNDQPCCCSRKEGVFPGVSLNFQESQLLRRRTMASVPVPGMEKQLSCEPNRRPTGLNDSMPGVISLRNFSNVGSEKVDLPVTKSAVAPASVNDLADSALKSPTYTSASPSTSNPVLRLMGKNLMVVNKEENGSQQFKPSRSGSLNDHPTPQYRSLSGFSPVNNQDEDFRAFQETVHQHFISGQNQGERANRVKLANSFGSLVTSKTPQTSYPAAVSMFVSKNVGSDFTGTLEPPHEYKMRCNFPNDRNGTGNGPFTPSAFDRNNVLKEIITIDDTPGGAAPYFEEGKKESRVTSTGISIPMAANCNSRHVNPFYCYQPQGFPSYSSQSHMVQTSPHRSSASPVMWNCTSEGSNVLPPGCTSSTSANRLRSPLYFSPSFS